MSTNRFVRSLAGILLAGALLRLCVLLVVPTQPVSDFYSYFQRAIHLREQGQFGVQPGVSDNGYPPGYPVVLSLSLWLPGDRLVLAKLTNVVLGVLAVGLSAVVGWRLHGARCGLVAAALFAFYPRYLLLTVTLASEALFQPLILLLSLVTMMSWRRSPALPAAALAGVLLGILTLTRAVALPLGILWPLSGRLAGKTSKTVLHEMLLLLTVQLAVLFPWALRNAELFDRLTFLPCTSGINLFIGNNDEATGGWIQWHPILERQIENMGDLPPCEIDAVAGRAARGWICSHPLRASALYLIKLQKILLEGERYVAFYAITGRGGAPPPQIRPVLPESHPLRSRAYRLLQALHGVRLLVVAAQLAGAWLLFRRRAKHLRASALLWFFGGAAYFPLTAALFLASTRFRWPAEDLLMPVAAVGIVGFGSCLCRARPSRIRQALSSGC